MSKIGYLFFDTEGVGATGPLMTVQWALDEGDTVFHRVYSEKVADTLHLLEAMTDYCVVGFNLVHDWFQIVKWYNILRQVTDKTQTFDAALGEIIRIEAAGPQPDDVCLRPARACDLMLLARTGKFQYLAKHKDIVIKKVPTKMQWAVIETLQKIKLPPGVTLKWRPSLSKTLRHDVVDLVGSFEGLSTSLKHLYSVISGEPQTGSFEEEVGKIPYEDQPDWMPWGGDWTDAYQILRRKFDHDQRAIDYAIRDIKYTRGLWTALGEPDGGDDDSELACCVGAVHWRGFAINKNAVERSILARANATASDDIETKPAAVLSALKKLMDPTEQLVLLNTKKTTLEAIERWGEQHPAAQYCKRVRIRRRDKNRLNTLRKLLRAGRFCFSMKVLGALSSRMSGGSEAGEGGMNAQGIPREKEFRELFLMAFSDEHLEGGDFDAFEVSIADAVYLDPQLAADIRSGKKFHAITGSIFYNMSYEAVLKTKGTLDDKYTRAKNGFFAYLYGCTAKKLATVLDCSVEEAEGALVRLKARYPGVQAHRDKLAESYSPIWQEGAAGSKIHWREPSEYVESILGFRRYFTLEWAVVRELYQLQERPPEEWNTFKGEIRRTDRAQTLPNAARSAMFGAMFSISSAVFRAVANHEIQSPGAQLTKAMQRQIWDRQPSGVQPWIVRPLNVHDEVLCPTTLQVGELESEVNKVILRYQPRVPMLKMGWSEMTTWGDK